MSNPTGMDDLLAYSQRYESRLQKILRYRGRDNSLTYCLGMWLDSTSSGKLQKKIRQKRLAVFFTTHLLAFGLILFSAAFLSAFAWYFFP